MIIKKKTFRLIIIYLSAALLLLGGFVYKEYSRAQSYRKQLVVNYSHAFSELSVCMNKISNSLQKVLYASSPSMLSSLCAEVYSEAATANMVIGSLPYSNIELEHTASFVAKTGDYVYFLLRNASAGNVQTEEETANLTQLSKNAKALSEQITVLQSALLSGELNLNSIDSAERELGAHDASISNTGSITSEFQKIEEEFPEMPTLIYDGPFSASIENKNAKLIEGKEEISKENALEIASSYSGVSAENLTFEYLSEHTIPMYVITGQNGNDTLSFEITVHGGYVVTFNTTRDAEEAKISEEEAVKSAQEFLNSSGFESMKPTYWEKIENEIIINFAYNENDVVFYPDLIKVTVALDTGEITGFDSLNYVSNHTDRNLASPKISLDDAQASLSKSLTVTSSAEAVIPTSGKNEIYCYEFKCQDTENGLCLVYINVETGLEEKILIMIENENGTLTI